MGHCFHKGIRRRDGKFAVARTGLIFFLSEKIESREVGLRVLIPRHIVINGQNCINKRFVVTF